MGILGAGVSGLYTAIMLQSLGIEFEIIEASGRVGGRLFTHRFEKGGENDYYVCFVYRICSWLEKKIHLLMIFLLLSRT